MRGAWSLERFGGNIRHEAADGRSICWVTVNEAIGSHMFWAYLRMVDIIGEVLQAISAWAELCPCHGESPQLKGPQRHSVSGLRRHIGGPACPLASRRAPECAGGALRDILSRLLRVGNSVLILDPAVARCREEDKQVVLSDFGLARRHCLLVVTAKLGHWNRVPWLLFGIAHHDVGVARGCAQRALQQHAAMGDACQHHWLTKLCCTQGFPVREQMVSFVGGMSLADLPHLERLAARFKFPTISERWIEGRHALMHQSLRNAPHHSAQHVAFAGIQPSLRKVLRESPRMLTSLAQHCKGVRNPMAALTACGLRQHPSVQAMIDSAPSYLSVNRRHRARLVELLYHVDLDTLYQDLGDNSESGEEEDLPRAAGATSVVVGGSSGGLPLGPQEPRHFVDDGASKMDPPGGQEADRMWSKYGLDHLRVLSRDAPPTTVYSLGPSLEGSQAGFLQRIAHDVGVAEVSCSAFQVHAPFAAVPPDDTFEDDSIWSDVGGVLFFRIVDVQPRLAVVSPQASKLGAFDSLAVARVRVLRCDVETRSLVAAVEEEGGTGVEDLYLLSVCSLSLGDFSTLRRWDSDDVLHYSLRAFPTTSDAGVKLHDILRGMLAAAAKAEGCGHVATEGDMEVITKLEKAGLITSAGSGGGDVEWVLSDQAC